MKYTNINIHKQVEFPALTLGNIIVDGLLYYNYSFPQAQAIAEDILAGGYFTDERRNIHINKNTLIHAIQRYCAGNTDIEIELCSDSAHTIFEYIREAVAI
jgi:hypothetical protein